MDDEARNFEKFNAYINPIGRRHYGFQNALAVGVTRFRPTLGSTSHRPLF